MSAVRLSLPNSQTTNFVTALKRAGSREIGGQLYGEQLAPSDFLVTDLAIQRRRGTVARFFVDLVQAARDAVRFFDRTGHRYTRYNYIGEWHSHPEHSLRPSGTDISTMQSLVCDPEFRGSFAVLMIVRLVGDTVRAAAWVFSPDGSDHDVDLELNNAR